MATPTCSGRMAPGVGRATTVLRPRLCGVCCPRDSTVVCSASSSNSKSSRKASAAQSVSVAEPSAGTQCAGGLPCWAAPAIIFGCTATLLLAFAGRKTQKPPYDPLNTVMKAQDDCQGTEDTVLQQRSQARARMSAHIARAVDLCRRGENIKAQQQLLLALSENDLCRAAPLDGTHSKDEMGDLYRLHIRYTEATPCSGTLHQVSCCNWFGACGFAKHAYHGHACMELPKSCMGAHLPAACTSCAIPEWKNVESDAC